MDFINLALKSIKKLFTKWILKSLKIHSPFYGLSQRRTLPKKKSVGRCAVWHGRYSATAVYTENITQTNKQTKININPRSMT